VKSAQNIVTERKLRNLSDVENESLTLDPTWQGRTGQLGVTPVGRDQNGPPGLTIRKAAQRERGPYEWKNRSSKRKKRPSAEKKRNALFFRGPLNKNQFENSGKTFYIKVL